MNAKRFAFSVSLFLTLAMSARVSHGESASNDSAVSTTPKVVSYATQLAFEPNVGQAAAGARFIARGAGYRLLLTADGMVLRARPQEAATTSEFVMTLVGANGAAKTAGAAELPGKSHYLIGKDATKWHTNVPTYAQVRYEGIYPGVDLLYYGNQERLEFDFVVAPGADARPIQFDLTAVGCGTAASQGSRPVTEESGDLVVRTAQGELRLERPIVYQPRPAARRNASSSEARDVVEARFVLLSDDRVGFVVGAYDKQRPLIIDPVLTYSSYLGCSSIDEPNGVAADAAGNAYVTGYTSTDDFPAVNALFEFHDDFGTDAYVTKIAPDGTIVFSTFLGGTDFDDGLGIAVDGSGYIYVVGQTRSADFPTPFGFQTTYDDTVEPYDAFIVQLASDGLALTYGSLLGGSNEDVAHGVAVDDSGHVYVTGWTGSSVFPTTDGAFMETGGGVFDAFVAKFDPAESGASSLVYSTHLGGSTSDRGKRIAVDSDGNAYVTGYTFSDDFPMENPIYDAQVEGSFHDAFVSKMNADGSALVFSTYLGAKDGTALDIDLDSSKNVYVTGFADSVATTDDAFQTSTSGSGDSFVVKIQADGSAFAYSTYLGGGEADEARGIAVDSHGSAYVVGTTGEVLEPGDGSFPTVRALQTSSAGQWDAFVTRLNAAGSALLYSTYLGGDHVDIANDVAVDGDDGAFVAGVTHSHDFPIENAFQDTFAGGTSGGSFSSTEGFGITGEGFVTKISLVPDFDVSAAATLDAEVGGSVDTPVTIESLDSFNAAVALSVASPPAGIAPTFDPSSVTPPPDGSDSSSMTVALGLSVVPGTYDFTVTGTAGALSHSTDVEVTVTASTSGTSDVVDGLTAIGCIDNSGVSNALLAKLAQAQAFIEAGKTQAAINTLNALLNQLNAQKGKHIKTSCTQNGQTFDPTAVLITLVQDLLDQLGATPAAATVIMGYVVNAVGAPVSGTVTVVKGVGTSLVAANTDATGFYYFPLTDKLVSGANYTVKTAVAKPYKTTQPVSQSFTWSGKALLLRNFVAK